MGGACNWKRKYNQAVNFPACQKQKKIDRKLLLILEL